MLFFRIRQISFLFHPRCLSDTRAGGRRDGWSIFPPKTWWVIFGFLSMGNATLSLPSNRQSQPRQGLYICSAWVWCDGRSRRGRDMRRSTKRARREIDCVKRWGNITIRNEKILSLPRCPHPIFFSLVQSRTQRTGCAQVFPCDQYMPNSGSQNSITL